MNTFYHRVAASFIVSVAVLAAFQANAASPERVSLHMMQENVDKGYTMEYSDGGFAVGMTPGLFSEPVRLVQKKVGDTAIASVQGKTRVSDIYEYEFRGAEMNTEKPVWVAIELNQEIDPYRVFRVHVYDGATGEWNPIPSSMDVVRNKVQGAIHTPYARLAVFEEAQIRTELTDARLTNGFEFMDSWRQFALAIFGGTYEDDQRLRIKRQDPANYPAPTGTSLAGNAVFEYDVVDAGVPTRALGVRMRYDEDAIGSRSMYMWNNDAWHKLDSRDDAAGRWMSAMLDRSHAVVGLFEDANVYAGVASFYWARNPDDAATHLFPLGTRLRVTNTETGASTIVTVRSTWGNADHPTRVIDIARQAFEKIENTSRGLAKVRIERVE